MRPALENIAYYHCDQLGTPQELTDRNAQLLWSANYKAWGEAKIQLSAAGVAQDVRNQHRYQGQYYDEETGLHYNRFRYYDPHMARYVSRDPIGLQGGSNNSAYVPNSNQWIDPLGLEREKFRMDGRTVIGKENYKPNLCTRQISQNPYPIRILPS